MAPLPTAEPTFSPVPAPPTLEATAVAVGGYRWLARRCFEVLGGWVPTSPEPAVAVAMATQAHHHAWHAELWGDRLPRVAHLDPEHLTSPPGPGAARVLDAMAAAPGSVERLAGLGRVVLPRLAVALSGHLAVAGRAGDGALVRVARMVLADVEADRLEVDALLQSLLVDGAVARRAAGAAGDLEADLLDGRGWALGRPIVTDGGAGAPGRPDPTTPGAKA